MDRRKFLKWGGSVIPIAGVLPAAAMEHIGCEKPRCIKQSEQIIQPGESADYTIRINTGLIEVGPQQIISTTTYNGQFPGPLLRFKEGQPAIVDIYNDTDKPEQFHWHGQFVPPDIDGAAEERTPYIPAHGMRREVFTPNPGGFRFYHTHVIVGNDLSAGHRHSFELTRIGGRSTSGIIKDVAMLGGFQEMDIDFTANNPGLTLFHCHMQLHMDFGFMALFDYV